MNKQNQSLALKISCGVILLSFFLNWFSFLNHTASGISLVFSDQPPQLSLISKLVLLFIPGSAGAILYFSIVKKENYPLPRRYALCMPAAMVLLFYFIIGEKMSALQSESYYARSFSANDILSMGFWLTLLASGFIVYLGFQKEKSASTFFNQDKE